MVNIMVKHHGQTQWSNIIGQTYRSIILFHGDKVFPPLTLYCGYITRKRCACKCCCFAERTTPGGGWGGGVVGAVGSTRMCAFRHVYMQQGKAQHSASVCMVCTHTYTYKTHHTDKYTYEYTLHPPRAPQPHTPNRYIPTPSPISPSTPTSHTPPFFISTPLPNTPSPLVLPPPKHPPKHPRLLYSHPLLPPKTPLKNTPTSCTPPWLQVASPSAHTAPPPCHATPPPAVQR